MNIFNTDLMTKVNILKTALDKTEALIIGAGAGLSTAAGLAYDNADTFNALFSSYHDRYGLNTINEADFYPFPTPEEQYAYWLRSIAAIRYNFPPGKPYLNLYRIIKDKITSSLPPIPMVSFSSLVLTLKKIGNRSRGLSIYSVPSIQYRYM
jgi:hypothetical protein